MTSSSTPPTHTRTPSRRNRMAAAYAVTGVVTVVFLLAAAAGFYLQGLVRTSVANWHDYQEHRQAQLGWLHDLRIEMGFGGLTSHLAAYAATGDETAWYRADLSLRRLHHMVSLRLDTATPEERPLLTVIHDGLERYQTLLASAKALIAAGARWEDIRPLLSPDQTAMVNALARLESLTALNDSSHNDEVEAQFHLLDTLHTLILPLVVLTLLAAVGVILLIRRFEQEIRRRERSDKQLSQFTARLRQEIEMARDVQNDLLPTPQQIGSLTAAAGLHLSYRLRPSTELSGDFWMPVDLGDGRVGVLLADMTGHGLVAAMNGLRMTDVVRRSDDYFVVNAAHLLANVSTDLTGVLPEGHFAAAVLALYDPNGHTLELAGAAVPPPLIYRHGDDSVETVTVRGLPLGIDEDARYDSIRMDITADTTLLLYSDALTETPALDGTVLTTELIGSWLRDAAIRRTADPTVDVAGELLEQALEMLGPDLPDDLTIIALTLPGTPPVPPPQSGLSAFVAALDRDI